MKEIYFRFALIYVVLVIGLSIPFILRIKFVASNATKQIMNLRDAVMVNIKQGNKMQLGYLRTNAELSYLHLQFNETARTLILTH